MSVKVEADSPNGVNEVKFNMPAWLAFLSSAHMQEKGSDSPTDSKAEEAPVCAFGEDDEGRACPLGSTGSPQPAKAWCGHHGLPLEKATFMFQQRVLMPEALGNALARLRAQGWLHWRTPCSPWAACLGRWFSGPLAARSLMCGDRERLLNGAEVPSEAKANVEAKEAAKTEAKARPRFDPLAVPRLLTSLLWRSLRTSSGPRDLMK